MDGSKLLGGVTLAVLAGWAVLTVVTLGGVGVDVQLLGSDWQGPTLVATLAVVVALAGIAALGGPWRDAATPYW